MSNSDEERQGHPFLFFNHGVWDFDDSENKSDEGYIWFERPLSVDDLKDITRGAPPFYSFARPAGSVVHLFTGDDFDSSIHQTYGANDPNFMGKLTRGEVQDYCDALDAWLCAVHERHPILFFTHHYGAEEDPWHLWSAERIPEVVLPRVRAFWERARSPEESTKEKHPPEHRAAWAFYDVVGAYSDIEDFDALSPGLADEFEWLLKKALGHAPVLDDGLKMYLRKIERGRQSSG